MKNYPNGLYINGSKMWSKIKKTKDDTGFVIKPLGSVPSLGAKFYYNSHYGETTTTQWLKDGEFVVPLEFLS